MQTTTSPGRLHAEMVERIRKAGHARRGEVERVLRATPRHEFVPEADLAIAYDPWQAVLTLCAEAGPDAADDREAVLKLCEELGVATETNVLGSLLLEAVAGCVAVQRLEQPRLRGDDPKTSQSSPTRNVINLPEDDHFRLNIGTHRRRGADRGAGRCRRAARFCG